MDHLKNKRLLTGSILIIAAALFLVLNLASGMLFKALRFDLTSNRLYTLSKGTKEIVREIEEPVVLRLYYSKSLTSINPFLASFASRVEDMLVQYQRASRGKIKVEIIDPEPFSSQEDNAVNAGLQGIPIDSTGTEFYLGLVGSNALNNKQIIPFLQPNRETNLEYDISQLIYKLANPQRPIIGVISSLPLSGGMRARPWAIWQQMSQLYSLESLDTDITEIPEEIKTLMLVEPSTFTDAALKAIDKFVMRGGHILAFVDPVSEVADAETAKLNRNSQDKAGDYIALLKAWGVDFNQDKMVADRTLAKAVRVQNQGREMAVRYPLWMDFGTDNIDKDDVIDSNLERLTLASPGYLTKSEDATTQFSPLVTTSDQATLLESKRINEYQRNFNDLINNYKADGAFTVAARISGPIKSPYSDANIKYSNIIIIADTDMLHDHFWINVQNIMGREFGVPNANNGNFVLSALDNLSGSNALISIRNRGTFARPFDTIRQLELQSQDKYHASEQALQQKLEVTKQKLDQLEAQKTEGNSIMLGAQQQQEAEAFRSELVETRRELRDVRLKLNKEIESVATRIKFFSIGFIPMLIITGGLIVWSLQFKRQMHSRRAECSTPKP